MNKTLLVSAVALGLSSVALANGGVAAAPVATAAVAPVTTSSDFTPGIYVGLQGGYADSGLKASNLDEKVGRISGLISTDFDHDKGIAGRVFIGYDINKYFAVEAGYLLLGEKTKFKINDQTVSDVRTQAFDLVGKIKAPIFTDTFNNVGVYAKAGVGYLMTDGRNKLKDQGLSDDVIKDKVDKFDLVYGFGVYYTLADNWTLDAGYTRYNSGHTKHDKEWQPVVDFYSVGVSYKFNLPV